MNAHDWGNLKFLLTADEASLKEWYDIMDEDDHKYAQEIMKIYQEELVLGSVLIDDPEIKNVDEASLVLSRFKLT
jgi:hypothetical protein